MALTKVSRGLLTTSIVDNGNDTAITIDASENVGVGTGSPASLLDVSSAGEVISTVRSTSTSGARQATLRLNVPSTGGDDPAGRVQFTYGTGYTVAGSIEMTHTNNAMKFLSGTTERMRISGSNVGIGTSTPTQELEIKAASIPTLKLNQAGTYGAEIALRGNDLDIAGSANAIVFYTGGNNDVSTTERMRISAAGVVTTPYQPSFQARLNANQTGFNSSGSFGLGVGFNVTDHNVGNHFNTSTGLFTAPVAGLYCFEGATYINTYALQSWFVKNGGRATTTDKMVGADGRFQDNNTILRLAANDTVGFHPFVVGDTNVTIINNANHTYFKGYLIG